jgi:hydroxymethylglutaryl-CoA lyase
MPAASATGPERGSLDTGPDLREVQIRDVGPRDGLQSETPVAPGNRAKLAIALAAAGVQEVEAVSFVSPRAVPAMAGAADVVAALPSGPRWWALVPNARGATMARDAGIDALTITISASEAYSEKNIGMSVERSLTNLPEIASAGSGAALDVVISCAFGSPFGDVAGAATTASVVDRVRGTVDARVTLADTTGAATPRRIAAVLDLVGTDVGLHLHDTRGTALANALAALARGVRRFDTAVGGLGGSPFAPGAGGNLATEDLVLVLEDMGVDTAIELVALLEVSRGLAALVGHDVPGRTSAAGPLPRFD